MAASISTATTDMARAEPMKYEIPVSSSPATSGIMDFCFQPYTKIAKPTVPQMNEATMELESKLKFMAPARMSHNPCRDARGNCVTAAPHL